MPVDCVEAALVKKAEARRGDINKRLCVAPGGVIVGMFGKDKFDNDEEIPPQKLRAEVFIIREEHFSSFQS